MGFWLVKLNKTWEKSKRKEKHLKNVIAHYKIREHYVRIYKSTSNFWVVEASILNCFAETLIELENNLRRIRWSQKCQKCTLIFQFIRSLLKIILRPYFIT